MSNVYGMILSGGSGTRLWPLSRENFPKQFLTLNGDKTLLQNTALRMLNVVSLEYMRVIAGEKWHDLTYSQLHDSLGDLPEHFVIEEPCARGTAPAILLAAEDLLSQGAREDDVMIVAPSDHVIKDTKIFADALKIAVNAAREGFLATLGIGPTRPETGFGYIRQGKYYSEGWYEASDFVEKPDVKRAREYVESRLYFWNGGIFIFTPKSLYRELEHADPELYSLAMKKSVRSGFHDIKNISIDNAVMEKAERVAVIPMVNSGWSDVGSWDALHDEILEQDDNQNVFVGESVSMNTRNCFVYSRNKPVILNSVSDLVIVDTPDALFITHRGASQEVRNVVKYLKEHGMTDKI